jgi:TPP-dependent pyruvate/acetoin dehydrogenase alpha subunit
MLAITTADTGARPRSETSEADKTYLLDCLKKILQIRNIEQYSLDLSQATPPAMVGSIHLGAGQEAVLVGTVATCGPPNVRMPATPSLSQELLPNAKRIADAVRAVVK